MTDFGIASTTGVDTLTLPGTVLGTAGYLSPEQARGEPATAASDRYGLGVVAFELLTGRRPFEADTAATEAFAHVNAAGAERGEHRAGAARRRRRRASRAALAKEPERPPGDLRRARLRPARPPSRAAAPHGSRRRSVRRDADPRAARRAALRAGAPPLARSSLRRAVSSSRGRCSRRFSARCSTTTDRAQARAGHTTTTTDERRPRRRRPQTTVTLRRPVR